MRVRMPKATILITRPEDQAQNLKSDLEQLGFEVLLSPMLKIEFLDFSLPNLADYDGYIFTSVNAVRAVSGAFSEKDKPVYCVGAKTYDALCEDGWVCVRKVSGNIETLENDMFGVVGHYLHLSGVDVVRPLNVEGVVVDVLPVYKAHKRTSFSSDIAEKLTQQRVDVVMFYSARTGQAFAEAVEATGCTSALEATKALCLSDLVVHSIEHLPWQYVHVAKEPDGDAMVSALKVIMSDCTED